MDYIPNYAGIFLRGYGSQNHTKNNGSRIGDTNTNHSSGQIGQIQGDAIREIYAKWGYMSAHDYPISVEKMIQQVNGAAGFKNMNTAAKTLTRSDSP